MRSLIPFFRMTEEMNRISLFRSLFYDDMWRLSRLPPWSQLYRIQQSPEATAVYPKIGKEDYQVSLDVGQYKPSELTVKVVDNSVVVEGKYEGREDGHGFISKHFVRSFLLPKGYKAESAISTLTSDGVLTVSVPKPAIEDKPNERVIPIQQTGPADLNVKENLAEENVEGGKETKDTN